jgi:hypothetical protein
MNISAGSYIVTVTDSTSCQSTATFQVIDNTTPITVTSLITPSTCNLNNGIIDITPNPLNGNSFLWSTGASTEDLQNLSSGNYSLTVTDGNGCTYTDTFAGAIDRFYYFIGRLSRSQYKLLNAKWLY